MVQELDGWNDKIAIVTGANEGCGASITEKLVKHGVQVVGIARRDQKTKELADKFRDYPGKLHAFKCDITKEDDIVSAFKWVKDNLGPIHLLVNNASIGYPTNLINGHPNEWITILQTNVVGLSLATKLAVQDMVENKTDGQIIHINSTLGHSIGNVTNVSMYPASKFAVTALTETLRKDLINIGSKIKITSISPGLVNTNFPYNNNLMSLQAYAEFFEQAPKLLPEDVADSVLYVLSTPPHVQIHELVIMPVGANY